MKQLGLFDQSAATITNNKPTIVWKLFIDGASKNNPGQAGSGFVLYKNDTMICKQGFYLGIKTNNQAEYYALVVGIFFAKKYMHKRDSLTIISDSQLLVRQMNGIYKVKNSDLQKLQSLSSLWLQEYNVKIEHVLRSYNTLADEMANRGVDKKILLPQEFLDTLKQHEIII